MTNLYEVPVPDPAMMKRPRIRFEKDSNEHLELGGWFVPSQPMNPGFDSFFTFGSYTGKGELEKLVIVFVQVTCAQSYTFDSELFGTAALKIAKRTQGFIHGFKDGVISRGMRKTRVNSGTKLYTEIIFAVPEGQSSSFKATLENSLSYLANLDGRWTKSRELVLEVPNSKHSL